MHPADTNNLSSSFLQFSQLTQEVPESTFCNCFVSSKYPHLVQGWGPLLVRGQTPANDFILLQLSFSLHRGS